jgi:ubiquinone/menaquinone biosynthesis C-methylase UbiE
MKDYDIANETKIGYYLTQTEWQIINTFLNKHTVERCLDCACGSGRISNLAIEQGIDIIAVDYDLSALKLLKSRIDVPVQTIKGDATALPFKQSIFDCVICIQAVGNIDPGTFFRECGRILKEDGYLLFNISNKSSYKAIGHRLFSNNRLFYRHTFGEIKEDLEKEGFTIQECKGYNWLPNKRNSDSRLIPYLAFLEKVFCLSHIPFISPHIFFIAMKGKRTP